MVELRQQQRSSLFPYIGGGLQALLNLILLTPDSQECRVAKMKWNHKNERNKQQQNSTFLSGLRFFLVSALLRI